MANSTSPEAKELNLISKVELRIALADSDIKLEAILKTFLAPLLLKLASENVNVRNKVISICQHINTRIKSPSLKLPVAALLQQFKDQISVPLIRHFDLLYVQQGIGRIPDDERVALLPTILKGLSSDIAISANHGAILFNLFLRLLPQFSLPARGSLEDIKLREKLGLTEDDASTLAHSAKSLMLLVQMKTVNASTSLTCPGLSPKEYQFLTLDSKPQTWDPSDEAGLNLTEAKINMAKFLSSGAFTDQERFVPAFYASSDSNSRIADIADDMLKRTLPNISLEDPALVKLLFDAYFGKGDVPPVRMPLRIKIIGLLLKSKEATGSVENVVRLVEEGFSQENTDEDPNRSQKNLGREASKLRAAVFAFTNWVARVGAPSDLQKMAPTVVNKLREFIESQGWPSSLPAHRNPGALAQRGFAYESIGLFAKSSPDGLIRDPDLDLVRFLFRSLGEDISGETISVSIDEALGGTLRALSEELPTNLYESIRSLFLQQISLEVDDESPSDSGSVIRRSTRFAATRFSNRVLSFSDIVGRWISLVGLFNSRNEVVEEARRGLDPYWYQKLNSDDYNTLNKSLSQAKFSFPKFSLFAESILGQQNPARTKTPLVLDRYEGRLINLRHPAVTFSRMLLITEAMASSSTLQIEENYVKEVDSMINRDIKSRKTVELYTKDLVVDDQSRKGLLAYVKATFEDLVSGESPADLTLTNQFIEICSLAGNEAVQSVVTQIHSLKTLILANDIHKRYVAAQAFGILGTNETCPSEALRDMSELFHSKIKNWKTAIGAEANQIHGSMIALAFLHSRAALENTRDQLQKEICSSTLTYILEILEESTDKTLQDGVYTALEQLGLFSAINPSHFPSPLTVIDKIHIAAKKGNENAIKAMSRLAMACDETEEEDSLLEKIRDRIFELYELRQLEVQFVVGESLSCLAVGWESKSLLAAQDVQGGNPKTGYRYTTLETTIDKILGDCKGTKPSLRKASIVWLLCLVQYCGHLQPIQERLRHLQLIFKSFLSDRDEIIQETASRGLSIVYDISSKDLRDDLVRDLVGSFTGGTANLSGTVTRESELFEPGALPTGEGSSITSYKDIMSLAAEVGDPSLVYKFMSLAANNAIWSSRAALANFGLSRILSDSSANGYLSENPKLYPKLYRFRFDPNTNVQRSMNTIWDTLVKDSSSTIDKYFDDIMQDLLKSIFSKEWRVRQGSCAAIADLVQGRSVEQYEKYLGDIWSASFKVMDDIKDSVRKAAMSLCRILTGTLVRNVESGASTKHSDIMLRNVMPFLESQLEASAEEVQLFALKTLLDLVKKGGPMLRPYIPDLVERLLALLSSLEPQEINYLHLNASKYNLTEEKIDAARLKSVRSSPMMDAIEKCFDHLDESTMKSLVPRLESAMRQAVGMPSKVGCSRAIVSLSTRRNFLFQPYADHFVKVLEKVVVDRNETVSSSYASALGYLARLVKEENLMQISQFSKKLYFDAEDEKSRLISADIVYAISKHSTDRFASMAAEFLPFVFLAKHDANESVRDQFQSTWTENVGGSRAVLLYLKEILALADSKLDSPRWALKHTSAHAVADVVMASGNELNVENARRILPPLERAINGKSWDGKEIVLKAVVRFAEVASPLFEQDPKVLPQIQKIIIREAKRKNATYRPHALESLAQFAKLDRLAVFPEVLDITSELFRESSEDQDSMDIDSKDPGGQSSKSSHQKSMANALLALLRSVPGDGKDVPSNLYQVLDIYEPICPTAPMVIQSAFCDGLNPMLDLVIDAKISFSGQPARKALERSLATIGCLGEGTEAFRMKRASVLITCSKVLDASVDFGSTSNLTDQVRRIARSWYTTERAAPVKALLDSLL